LSNLQLFSPLIAVKKGKKNSAHCKYLKKEKEKEKVKERSLYMLVKTQNQK